MTWRAREARIELWRFYVRDKLTHINRGVTNRSKSMIEKLVVKVVVKLVVKLINISILLDVIRC